VTLKDEIGKRREFDSPEQETLLNVLRTASVLAGPIEELLAGHGLSGATYNVLRILRGATLGPDASGRRSCSQIGEHLVAKVPDVTRLVDRLERMGLVERERCVEDRRVVYVKATRRGLDLLARLDRPVLDLHQRQLGHMARAELAELCRLLTRVRSPRGG
jgi:DNA-binding MarR family transcriptional regulator